MDDLFTYIKNTMDSLECLNEQLVEYDIYYKANEDATHLQELGKSIFQSFNDSNSNIVKIKDELDSILVQLNQQATSGGQNQPLSIEKIRNDLKLYFKTDIKKDTSPIPSYTGCFAAKSRSRMKEGNFICAHIQGHFYLYIIESYVDGICKAYDPADINNGVHSVSLTDDEWTPMPTVLTNLPRKRFEFTNDSEVLSLYREKDDDEWTTEFYQAKVIKMPSDRIDEPVRGYLLLFEGSEKEHIVPEKFVIQWKNKV